jgi:hypothetical protein
MRRLIELMLGVALVIDVAYWSIWFTHRDWLASDHTQAYYDFENAFPLADLWLGIAILMALIAMRAHRPSALFWLICSGAAGLYLGSLDLLYDLEHGIFVMGAGGAVEAGIVVLTWVFSITLLRWSWTHRGELA